MGFLSSLRSFPCIKRRRSTPLLQQNLLDEENVVESESIICTRKPGWKAMPYILGNNTTERLATYGVQVNFMVYLMKVYNMDQVLASNIMNTWVAVSNVAPLFGAFLADAYFGKYLIMILSSFASLAGLMIITLISWVPQFHPVPCTIEQQQIGECLGHTNFQLWMLLFCLLWLSIGSGGIRPCSIPFAVDQFDLTTVEGRHGSSSFYNLYYTTQTLLMLISQTIMVYIQDSVSWALGFGLFTVSMAISIVVFFSGTNVYSYVKPDVSIFSSIPQVVVAALHKRRLYVPTVLDHHSTDSTPLEATYFYDPPFENDDELEEKLPLTDELRWLNKAALIMENDLNTDGSKKDPWRLCSIQQVEEFKCMVKIIPIWVASIIFSIPIVLQGVFPISQALKMDRMLGQNFEIHPGYITVITLVAIGVFLPLYDKFVAPALEKITKQEGGLTTLQKIGIGNAIAILVMVVSGVVERKRRDSVIPLHVLWLAPQSVISSFCYVFGSVGLVEFINNESPKRMRSIANSLLYLNVSVASNISTFIINIVHAYTGNKDQPDWLDSDIDKGRLDYFYFILAGLGVLNMFYFILCARPYSYKTVVSI